MTRKVPGFSLAFVLASFALFSCQDDEQVTQPEQSISIDGYVQKGPFINGTAITVSELDQKLVATGKNFTTQIIDNKGAFSLRDIKLQSDFVQLIAEGFYFDEVRGEKSAAQLTLFALADVSSVNSVNVNLLSHLEKDRVTYLMQEEEQSFVAAKQQAQREILAIFGINKTNMAASELLDISQDGDDNAILLAISAILQGNNTVAELSELLADIITDIRKDGVLDSESTKGKLRTNATQLTLTNIRQHLESRYEELGVDATIPNFEQYVDSDGDGFLNKDEDDTPDDFAFEPQIDVAVDTVVVSNEITISGLKEGGKAIAQIRSGKFINSNPKTPDDSIDFTNLINKANLLINGQPTDNRTPVQVRNGDRLQIALQSSSLFSGETIASVSLGSFMTTFKVVTDDYSPNPFSFKEITNARLETVYVSDTIVISGLPHLLPEGYTQLSLDDGAVYVNGKKHISNDFSLKNSDQLWIEVTSAKEYQAKRTALLTINDKSANFTVTAASYPLQEKSGFPGELSQLISFSVGQYLFAGTVSEYVDESESRKFFKFDKVTDKWIEIASFPGIPRNGSVAFSANGKGYVGLGHNAKNGFFQDLWIYDPELDSWSQFANFPGEARAYASAFTIGNNAYIGLGYHSLQYGLGHNESTLIDFWRFNTTDNSWNQVSDFVGKERSETFCFSTNDKGYIGVPNRFDTDTMGELWEYNQEKNQWTQKASFASPQESGIGFSVNEKGYVIFGYEKYIREYNSSQDVWLNVKKDYSVDGIAGGSVLEKGYIIDQQGKFYEFTPPQD